MMSELIRKKFVDLPPSFDLTGSTTYKFFFDSENKYSYPVMDGTNFDQGYKFEVEYARMDTSWPIGRNFKLE